MFLKKMKKIICSLLLTLFSMPVWAANNEFSVLCYHNVVDESITHKEPQYFPQTISVHMLVEHFNWLKHNGYTPVSWQQILDAKNGGASLPDKAVLLTFDDGYASFYHVIYPLLKAYNYPAVYGIVTDWINTPANKKIQYGNQKLNRSSFVTWQQLKEMQQSGLVEMASHTHDLHHGIAANPGGSSLPAVITPQYQKGKYETVAQYRARLKKDFQRSSDLLKAHLGVAPRIMIWPYGQFTDEAVEIARQTGLQAHFSLRETKINTPSDPHVGRLLLDTETSIGTIARYLEHKTEDNGIQRTLRIKLDMLYDPNPVKQKQNLDKLIERIYQYGITRVYLQAFSDADGDGVAEALYFNNKYLPVRADIFSQVAWSLRTRAEVEVYAWLPVLAFDLAKLNPRYVTDSRSGVPDSQRVLRLSPYEQRNTEMIKAIYRDLSFHSKFDGLLFHDDVFLTDFEGVSQKTAKQKTSELIALTEQLKQAVTPYALGGKERLKTARSLYAPLVTQPESEQWFAQNLDDFIAHYDTVSVMAMPYMEHQGAISARKANRWLINLAETAVARAPKNKLLFELQAVNQRTGTVIPDDELIGWMNSLQEHKIYNFGYSPDNFLSDQPELKKLKLYFSVNTNISR